ncbi:kinase-like domain-containing protein [Xylariomycetidae sp. FL0641]|nr:kinase-like domain-containing protein [Xylariomycetidae sp. FL0641]
MSPYCSDGHDATWLCLQGRDQVNPAITVSRQPRAMSLPDADDGKGSDELSPIDRLEEQLTRVETPTQDWRYFIPRTALESSLDPGIVFEALRSSHSESTRKNASTLTQLLCDPESRFKKVFCVLVLARLVDEFAFIVGANLDDSCLPIPKPEHDDGLSEETIPADQGHLFVTCRRAFKRITSHHFFFRLQWAVLAPTFEASLEVKHFVFGRETILPFLEVESETQRNDGGYGEVHKIRIHPDHYDFGDYGIHNPQHIFALKKLRSQDYGNFSKEVGALKRVRNLDHVLQLLASFEVAGSYHLIFPWASGDLIFFWQYSQALVGDKRICPWVSTQFRALAEALSAIHRGTLQNGLHRHHDSTTAALRNAELDPNGFLDADLLYGRHGDIKPSNILWYPSSDKGVGDLGKLVLGDFGLSAFHRKASMSVQSTSSFPYTLTYRAPEIDNKEYRKSRMTDIWSFGCVLLEFLVWYLLGFDAILEFSRARLQRHPAVPSFYEDTFFTLTQSTTAPTINAKVVQWASRLRYHPNYSSFLAELLHIILDDMLEPNHFKRASAADISQKLRCIEKRCWSTVDYYTPPRNHPEERLFDDKDGPSRGILIKIRDKLCCWRSAL